MTLEKNQHSVHVVTDLIDTVAFGKSRVASDKEERDCLIERLNVLDKNIRDIEKNNLATIEAIAVLLLQLGFIDGPRTIQDLYAFFGDWLQKADDIDEVLKLVLLKFSKQ